MSKKDPLKQLEGYWHKAQKLRDGVSDYCYLATVDSKNKPHVRTVLIKTLGPKGIGFVTNQTGPKVSQMKHQREVECCVAWPSLTLQVRIRGKVVAMPQNLVEKLWRQRPRLAQILYSAGLRQSSPIPSYEYLLQKVSDLEKKWEKKKTLSKIPNYIGFMVKPKEIEFLNHHPSRLNKRELFIKQSKGWKKFTLAP